VSKFKVGVRLVALILAELVGFIKQVMNNFVMKE
jgi:hypothetical protein